MTAPVNNLLQKLRAIWSPMDLLLIAVIVILHVASARLGFTFAPPDHQVTVVWPASGLELAFVLLFGYRMWPAIMLGTLIDKMIMGTPFWMGGMIGLGNTLEPLIGAWLIQHYACPDRYLERLRGVMGLWFFASLVSTLVSAALGTTAVWLSGLQPLSAYGAMFMSWWLADASGILLIAPLILAWATGGYTIPSIKTFVEAAALLIVSILFGIVIFIYPSMIGTVWVYPYMIFPLVLWAAIRFGQRGMSVMILSIANICLSSILYGVGPFSNIPQQEGLVVGQIFVMIVAMTGLTICAAISERLAAEKKVQENLQYTQNVIDHIPDPVFMKNKQNVLIGGNNALWALLRQPAVTLVGNDYDTVFDDQAGFKSFNQMSDLIFNATEPVSSEETYIDQAGHRHVLYFKATSFQDNKGEPLMVAVMRDITHLKETEERLVKYTQELEVSNRELDSFAYVASHDLKEPLRGLQSFSQFLMEDYKDKLDADGQRKLTTIADLAKRLDDLLNVLLHYSRLGRTGLAVAATDLNNVVKSVTSVLSVNLTEKNAVVEVPQKLPTIVCDHVRIGEVFQNLISNAIKYCDAPTNKIEVGFTTEHTRLPGKTVFYVRDHGIGISEKYLESVFKIFKRLHAKEAYGGGTGSGLAIAKKIIMQHGGEIWVESKGAGQGSTFFFTIPERKA